MCHHLFCFRYNDGLDQWRLTATEVREEFAKKGADVVYAFQTRNPTHAGHAYLMRTAGDKLRAQVRACVVRVFDWPRRAACVAPQFAWFLESRERETPEVSCLFEGHRECLIMRQHLLPPGMLSCSPHTLREVVFVVSQHCPPLLPSPAA